MQVKLKYLDEWNQRRTVLAERYSQALQHLPIHLPKVSLGAHSVWYLYVIRVSQRDKVQSILKEKGIETLIHYPIPPHMQNAYQDLNFKINDFPIAQKMADELLSLPIGPQLQCEDQDYVIETLSKTLSNL